MPLPPPLKAIVKWLRAGYPTGTIPEQDYVPVFALLPRKLSEQEIRELADLLNETTHGAASPIDIGVFITKITNELPRAEDVERVRSRLGDLVWEDEDTDGSTSA
ncbi:DUF3349 domain-containing protein [Segniliparus rugosus]|uniref:DUF3349 domain-containing protein n=1 Tax=Segniliparus rugosus (strain ATCC BAA-974 / DSM 45345 / CCUG 50838 / CIP 108380 / JCM 13579 / CDC 945) TaxID=679197 RepID=E5XRD3_SEGRC|nr:DUF3349 domain-containing protein [Segniliparus rugosus]EFV13103.1 hypothetical protein HMPREF9336_02055 [Segniliparus rugosus ATCC BAA-974]